ncbi:MAG: R3H domain-containing nucleic acid-binding protein, partial [Pseudomonadota bacterium]
DEPKPAEESKPAADSGPTDPSKPEAETRPAAEPSKPEKKQQHPRKKPPRNKFQDKPRDGAKPDRKPAPPRGKQTSAREKPPAEDSENLQVMDSAESMDPGLPGADTMEGMPEAESDTGNLEMDTVDCPPEEEEEIDEWEEGFPPKYKDEIPVDVPETAIKTGVETLQRIVDLITTEAVVEAETDQDRLLLKVKGGNSGVLIGRRGQTMEAMQFITDKIINRSSESRVRLRVDVEGYMETRKANLISLAHKMADKAKKTGKPATINQMTAQDRRTVHLALKDDAGVRTQSMGDGYYRRLVIFPKKGSFKKRRPPKN